MTKVQIIPYPRVSDRVRSTLAVAAESIFVFNNLYDNYDGIEKYFSLWRYRRCCCPDDGVVRTVAALAGRHAHVLPHLQEEDVRNDVVGTDCKHGVSLRAAIAARRGQLATDAIVDVLKLGTLTRATYTGEKILGCEASEELIFEE